MPVNSQHPDYTRLSKKWKRCRDVVAGQDAIHEAAEEYLPKLKSQQSDDYSAMIMRASFYNASWRTIAGLLGMMFRKPPKIEVPEGVKELLKDINASGTPFSLLLQDDSENALTTGRVGILVDYPPAPEEATQADALRLGLRPIMNVYRAEAILNWEMGKVNNQWVPVLVVLKEKATIKDPADEFVPKIEDRWRVLDLVHSVNEQTKEQTTAYRQRLFRAKAEKVADKDSFERIGGDIYPKMNNQTLSYIPFYCHGTDMASLSDVDDPPLIDLFDMNLSHYRTSADFSHGCHFTALPFLLLAGFKKEMDDAGNEKQLYIGGEAAIVTSNPDAKGSYVEFTGTGLSTLVTKLEREEQMMAVLGARMLEPQTKAVKTAESEAIHRKGEESTLGSIAIATSLAMTAALKCFVEWAGFDPKNVSVEINRNFYPAPMTPMMLSALISGWQQGAPGLSDQGLFDQLKAGEVVAEDVTLEDEQARIAERQQNLMDQQIAAQKALGNQTE